MTLPKLTTLIVFYLTYWLSQQLVVCATPGQVVSWPNTNVPAGLTNVVAIAASEYSFELYGEHALAVRNDGSVVSWIVADSPAGTLTNVPSDLSNVVAVAAEFNHDMALKGDGTVVDWDSNGYAYTNVTASLSNVVAIAAGSQDLALLGNGTIMGWRANGYGQATGIPTTNASSGLVTLGGQVLSNVTAIAAGSAHSLALKGDGTVVAWGYNAYGQTNVPVGLSNVTFISARGHDSLALRNDGTAVMWGLNTNRMAPSGLTNVTALSSGIGFSLALKSNGRVVGWGYGSATNISGYLSNVVVIAAGDGEGLAITIPLKISSIERTNQKPLLRFHTFSGQNYSVEYSPDLSSNSWSDLLGTNIQGTGQDIALTDTNVTPAINRFYRLKLTP